MVWPFDNPTAGGAEQSAPPGQSAVDPRQLYDARQTLVNEKKRMDEIGAWSVMNANLQTHMLAAKAAGLDPYRSIIPWGNSTTNINQQSGGLAKSLLVGAALLAGGGGGAVGLASLSGLLGGAARPLPAAVDPQPKYEWVLEVNHGDGWKRIERIDQGGDARRIEGGAGANRGGPDAGG